MSSATALFVAGGTGGHLYPGIAAARALVKQKEWKAVFAVRKGDLGKDLLQREGFEVIELSGQGMPRRLSLNVFTFPVKVAAGFAKAWSVLGSLKPSIVVGMGGYLSFPVLLAACCRGIPTLIHEQNVLPGVANRLLSRIVDSVAVSFPESQKVFPAAKTWVSGLPVRPEFGTIGTAEARRHFDLSENKLTFLIFGGSQGAQRINQAVVGAWPRLSDRTTEFQVLHVTGENLYAEINAQYKKFSVQAVVVPYCHDMAAALAAADFVICRSGASTIAELMVAQKPSLLIPFPNASENHQFYNAEILVSRGAAELIPDAEFTAEKLADRLKLFLRSPERLAGMRARFVVFGEIPRPLDAAQRLADYITHSHE